MAKRTKRRLVITLKDSDGTLRDAFDLKLLAKNFPMISVKATPLRIYSQGSLLASEDYDHFSIPPDLNLHLSDKLSEQHHYFDTTEVRSQIESTTFEGAELFTWYSPAVSDLTPFMDRKSLTFNNFELIKVDDATVTKHSRLLLSMHVHKADSILQMSLPSAYCTLARKGMIIGPYEMNDLAVRGRNREWGLWVSFYLCLIEGGQAWGELHIPYASRGEPDS